MKLRIFVIDDEECIRDTFRWYLEDQGHEVITAESPKTIINFSNNCNRRKHACGDVFFVDHNMPEMTGMTFLEHASKKLCKLPQRNKVLMSGALTQDLIDRAKRMGCTTMKKPVKFSQIDAFLEKATARVSPERLLAELKI